MAMEKRAEGQIANRRAKAVAKNIRAIRLIKNCTQDYLATRLNISQNAYSKIELGHTKITVVLAFLIADILEVDIALLMRPDLNATVMQLPARSENESYKGFFNKKIKVERNN
jgi:transcriptional regulator with XRE-family HTH domain